ncbi:hypothetical protein [Haloplanus halophilus]|nr:hypothetical protein [Haloplanus sp. GDY1]
MSACHATGADDPSGGTGPDLGLREANAVARAGGSPPTVRVHAVETGQ